VPQSGQDHIRDPFHLGAGEGVQAAADVQVNRAGQHLGEEVGVDRGQFTARHGAVHDFGDSVNALAVDVDAQKKILLDAFSGHTEWKIPQLLDAVRADPEFSFDSVSQIHLPSWHRGCIALVGDAAHCAALLSEELEDAGGDHTVAFVRYEQLRYPCAEFAQNTVTDGGELIVPSTREAVDARNARFRASTT
jgi:2-polyprenyl-6-methoxyphenol hydroxylase-like FAD-dependent oxidoreductase